MEKIIKVLKEEIKSLSLEENINISKLRELVDTYERLSGYVTTSVSQIPEQSEANGLPFVPNYGAGVARNIPRNNVSMFMDIIKDTLLRQNKSVPSIIEKNNAHDSIWIYKFLDETESKIDFDSLIRNKTLQSKTKLLKIRLYERIIDMTEKSLDEQEAKEKEESELSKEINEQKKLKEKEEFS